MRRKNNISIMKHVKLYEQFLFEAETEDFNVDEITKAMEHEAIQTVAKMKAKAKEANEEMTNALDKNDDIPKDVKKKMIEIYVLSTLIQEQDSVYEAVHKPLAVRLKLLEPDMVDFMKKKQKTSAKIGKILFELAQQKIVYKPSYKDWFEKAAAKLTKTMQGQLYTDMELEKNAAPKFKEVLKYTKVDEGFLSDIKEKGAAAVTKVKTWWNNVWSDFKNWVNDYEKAGNEFEAAINKMK